ncbi:MAG: M28 family peptidase [Pseudomonadota bacterium]
MTGTLLLLGAMGAQAGRPIPAPPTMEEGAALLAGQALASDGAWRKLATLCDTIGHRIAGSPELARAVTWGVETMRAEGLEVHLEPVQVPVWVRGEERVELLAPMARPLHALTIGGSVGTGPEGVEGDVMVVASIEELKARAGEAAGKLVLFDVPWEGYGQAVQFRSRGASAAAAVGAVGALVRSPTPTSLATPHTGALRYDDASPRVPAVILTLEDSAWLRRLVERGEVPRVRLVLGAEDRGEALSHNVVGEVRGRVRPEEVVILSGHLDSWDLGQGAQDDGAGCVTAMEAGRLLAALPVPPRRTVRVILYVNEENGLSGGRAYAGAHAAEVAGIVAAIEADTGAGQPLGFSLDLRDPATGLPDLEVGARAVATLAPWAPLLRASGAVDLTTGGSGSDISPLVALGVPGLGLSQDTSGYWPIHHTAADTLDKVDPTLLARNAAALAVMGWLLAEAEEPLPRVGPRISAPAP